MIYKILKYKIILLVVIFFSLLLSFSYKQLLSFSKLNKEIQNKSNYLEKKDNSVSAPLLCFQGAYKLNKSTNISFSMFPITSAIPNSRHKNKNDKFINFDRFGFRNNNEVWDKLDNEFLILGDSVVFDAKMANNELFTNNLKENGVINLGCAGNGLLVNLYLFKSIIDAGYSFDKVLFFLNLENDLSKDTMREYESNQFKGVFSKSNGNSLFKEQKIYSNDYNDFVDKSFKEFIENTNPYRQLLGSFKMQNFINHILSIKKKFSFNDNILTQLAGGSQVKIKNIPHNTYTLGAYSLLLKVLEMITFLNSKNSAEITFIIVPSREDYSLYTLKKKSRDDWVKYIMSRHIKNSIMTAISNYNFPIIDLFDLTSKNNSDIFDGHFTSEGHKILPEYLSRNFKLENHKKLQKFILYNSYFPSKVFSNYSVNFGKSLNKNEIESWLNSANSLITQNKLDDFLLAPVLGYLFTNNHCKYIEKLNNISKTKLLNYNNGQLFYSLCNLKTKKDLNDALKKHHEELNYYFPLVYIKFKELLKYEN